MIKQFLFEPFPTTLVGWAKYVALRVLALQVAGFAFMLSVLLVFGIVGGVLTATGVIEPPTAEELAEIRRKADEAKAARDREMEEIRLSRAITIAAERAERKREREARWGITNHFRSN